MHGGGPGIERIAVHWAYRNGVYHVVCKPDSNVHGRAAPFRRNVELLNLLPKGVIAFPRSGITHNVVDRSVTLGIRVQRVRPEPASPSRVASLRRHVPRFLSPTAIDSAEFISMIVPDLNLTPITGENETSSTASLRHSLA